MRDLTLWSFTEELKHVIRTIITSKLEARIITSWCCHCLFQADNLKPFHFWCRFCSEESSIYRPLPSHWHIQCQKRTSWGQCMLKCDLYNRFRFILGIIWLNLTVNVESTQNNHYHQADGEHWLVEAFTQEVDILYRPHDVVNCCILDSWKFHEVVTDWDWKSHNKATREK